MVWPALCQNLGSVRQKRMRVFLLFAFVAVMAGGAVVLARSPYSATAAHCQECQEDKALRLVHVVFRHGQRTPADTYPNDVYINHTFAPFGLGQLTNVGKKFQYDTGMFLRNRFDKFLGPLYSSGKVFAQSTQPDRAQISCMLTVAGMWPPKGTELDWNPNINWNPITVKFEALDQDTLLLARKDCPRYYEARDKVFQSPEVLQIFKDNDVLLKQLTEITGMKIENPDDVQSLYSTLKAEEGFGLVLPKWTDDYYPHKLEPLTETSFILNAYNSELQKLKGGPLVKKLISDWSAKAANKLTPPERKIFVYSGHDSTVSNLLLALGSWDKQVPNYGIMVIFELYEDLKTNEFGVEFFLRNSTTAEPIQLTIPGCDAHCPLTKLIELTKNVVPDDWPVDCKSNDPNYVPPAAGGP